VTARKKAMQAHRALLNGGKLSYFEERGILRFRGVSYVKPITAAKEAVSIIDLADKLTGPGGPRRRCPAMRTARHRSCSTHRRRASFATAVCGAVTW
jgi:hypothetical protein